MKAKGVVAGLAAAGGRERWLARERADRQRRHIDETGQGRRGLTYKSVKSAADLAINGAPPMFAEPLHVGRPNIGNHKRFLQRASDILDSGWLSNNGPIAQEFERRDRRRSSASSTALRCATARSRSKSRRARWT